MSAQTLRNEIKLQDKLIAEFDEALWYALVEKVIVANGGSMKLSHEMLRANPWGGEYDFHSGKTVILWNMSMIKTINVPTKGM